MVSPNNVLQKPVRCVCVCFQPNPLYGNVYIILVMIVLALKINHSCVSYENFFRKRECDIHKAADGICVMCVTFDAWFEGHVFFM